MTIPTWTTPIHVAVRGSLVVLAGRGESEPVYERFTARLVADGYRVAVVPESATDLHSTRALVTALFAPDDVVRPRVLIGSDAGAAVALRLASDALADGAVVVGALTSREGSDLDWAAEIEARTACPVHRGKLESGSAVHAGSLAEVASEAQVVDAALAASVQVPVLAIHGGADAISPLAPALEAYFAVPDVEVSVVTGGRHDVLNDSVHRSVAATIVLFLERLKLPVRGDIVARVDRVAAPVH